MQTSNETKTDFLIIKSMNLSDIKDLILNQRYQVGKLIHNGENSSVFKCKDITNTKRK